MDVIEIQIYWSDITPEKQQELLEEGFVNENVLDDTFPLTTLMVEKERE